MEAIVADDNSACGLDAVIRAAPCCRVVPAPIQGAGPARNAAAAVARGEILAFIDSDCDPRPDWIENGARALAAYDFAGGHVGTAPRDFITGEQKRAPRLLQRLALEWASRLALEPRRLAQRYFVESPRGIMLVLHHADRRHAERHVG